MRKMILWAFLLSLIIYSGAGAIYTGEPSPSLSELEPVGLIVKFKADVEVQSVEAGKTAVKTGLAEVDDLHARYVVKQFRAIIPEKKRSDYTHPFRQVFVIRTDDKARLAALKEEYESMPTVEYVEFDYPLVLFGNPTGTKIKPDPNPDLPPPPPPPPNPNDPLYSWQWYLNNINQTHPRVENVEGCDNDQLTYVYGTAGASINADLVFDYPPSNTEEAVVAVIDLGVDINHAELANRIWINVGEIPGNYIDDDHNGYIDDVNGMHFWQDVFYNYYWDNNVMDTFGHGTHIAGIVSAVMNNGVGVAGICPDSKIMPLKISLTVGCAMMAVIYAADNGADVVNMSFGGYFPSNSFQEAINYAHAKGVVLCASMGNHGQQVLQYPAGYDGIIAVGATDHDDNVTSFSTYGEHISVSAPGESILSLRAAGTDMYGDYCEPDVHIIQDYYYLSDGTSMSCPVVAGIAAYLKAVAPGLHPDSIKNVLEISADDITDPYDTGAYLPGWDIYSGFGRVNLYSALYYTPKMRALINYPLNYQTLDGIVTVTGLANGINFTSYTLEYGFGNDPDEWYEINTSSTSVSDNGVMGVWDTDVLPGGFYTVRLRVGEYSLDQVFIYIEGAIASILTPSENDTIISGVNIYGTSFVDFATFDKYVLDYRHVDSSGDSWNQISFFMEPKFDEYMTYWYTYDLIPGDYILRLRTFIDTGICVAQDTVLITVNPSYFGETWQVDLQDTAGLFPTYSDFDNDGLNEIIVGTTTGLKIFNPDGTVKDTGIPYLYPGSYLYTFVIGNLDGDGIDDILVIKATNIEKPGMITYADITVIGYMSNGGAFSIPIEERVIYDNANQAEGIQTYVILKDINNDNIDEVFIKIRKTDGSNLILTLQQGFYGVGEKFIDCDQVCAVDLENDGTTELYLYDRYYSRIRKYDSNYNLLGVYDVKKDGVNYYCFGISAYDIDGDLKPELILSGKHLSGGGFWLYAFDEGPVVKEGWPQNLNISSGYEPTNPVFGDIDNDGELEYLYTYYDLSHSYIYARNIDGTPVIPGEGLFLKVPDPCVLNYLLLADMNYDGLTDIIGIAESDLYYTNPGEWLYVWDNAGELLPSFPIMLNNTARSRGRHTPLIGDVNQDGHVDITITSALGKLHFMNFDRYPFLECKSPVTSYRYHRSMDNLGPSYDDTCDYLCGDANGDGSISILDIDYLVDFLFIDGPPPDPYEAGDVNCVTGITIGDIGGLVGYLFLGSKAPCDCESGGAAKIANPIMLTAGYEDGRTVLSLSSPVNLRALQIEFSGPSAGLAENSLDEAFTLIQSSRNGRGKMALLDMEGKQLIERGDNREIIRVPDKLIIESAIAIDENNMERTVMFSNRGNFLLPREYAFYQNYPNPFNPSTTFSFDLPVPSEVRLEIFNILGQKVATVLSNVLPAGRHEVDWRSVDADGQGIASGVYFAKFSAGSFTNSKKIMLLK